MEPIRAEDLDWRNYRNNGDLAGVWDACDGPIYRCLDEQGNNPEKESVRHLHGTYWLVRDDVDGIRVIHEQDLLGARLAPEAEA